MNDNSSETTEDDTSNIPTGPFLGKARVVASSETSNLPSHDSGNSAASEFSQIPVGPYSGKARVLENSPTLDAPKIFADASLANAHSQATPGFVTLLIGTISLIVIFVIASRIASEFVSLYVFSPLIAWAYLATIFLLLCAVGALALCAFRRLRRIRDITVLQEMTSDLKRVDHAKLRSEFLKYLRELGQHGDPAAMEAIQWIYVKFDEYGNDGQRDIEMLNEYLLDPLDMRAKAIVDRHAVQAGAATAFASHSFDGLIVLWHSISMIDKISRLYYGRPGLLGTIRLLRTSLTAVVFAETADLVARAGIDLFTNSAFASLGGRATEGLTNGVMIIRLGEAIRRQCRPIFDQSSPDNSVLRLSRALISCGWAPSAASPPCPDES